MEFTGKRIQLRSNKIKTCRMATRWQRQERQNESIEKKAPRMEKDDTTNRAHDYIFEAEEDEEEAEQQRPNNFEADDSGIND